MYARWKITLADVEWVANPVTGVPMEKYNRMEEFVGWIDFIHGVLVLEESKDSRILRAYAPGQWLKVERDERNP